MNWEAISAIGEIVGATAVVVSLVYVAAQIRENSRTTRSATRQAIADSVRAPAMIWAQNEDFSKVFQRHLDGEDLEAHQYLRLQGYCYVCFRNWENVHYQFRTGMLEDDEWRGFRLNLKALLQIPVFQDAWDREGEVYSQPFRKEVTALLDEIQRDPILPKSVLFEPRDDVD
jgi:hypothetical protein